MSAQVLALLELLDVVGEDVVVVDSIDHRYALIGLDLDEVLQGGEDASALLGQRVLDISLPAPAPIERERLRAEMSKADPGLVLGYKVDVKPDDNKALAEAGFNFKITIEEFESHGDDKDKGFQWKCSCGGGGSISWTKRISVIFTGSRGNANYNRIETVTYLTTDEVVRGVKERARRHKHRIPKGWVPGITREELRTNAALRSAAIQKAAQRARALMIRARKAADEAREAFAEERRLRCTQANQRPAQATQDQHLAALKRFGLPGEYEKAKQRSS